MTYCNISLRLLGVSWSNLVFDGYLCRVIYSAVCCTRGKQFSLLSPVSHISTCSPSASTFPPSFILLIHWIHFSEKVMKSFRRKVPGLIPDFYTLSHPPETQSQKQTQQWSTAFSWILWHLEALMYNFSTVREIVFVLLVWLIASWILGDNCPA